MSYIQLPYGYVEKNKEIQFNLPSNFEESFYLSKVPHLTRTDPAVENDLINLIKKRDDLKKWLLATSNFGDEIQDDLNAIVGYDEKFTNAIVRHSLDLKDEVIFRNPNPLNVTFHDMKKFDLVNPIIGKLASQVKASKLTDYEITKIFLQKHEADEIQNILDKLRYGTNKGDNDDNNNKPGPGGGSGKTPIQTMDDLTKRLDKLRGNTDDVSPYNTPEQNSRIIMKKNNEKFVNRQINQREKELKQIPKGIVNKRRSTINLKDLDTWKVSNYRFPETPPETPDDYWNDVDRNWISGDLGLSSLSGPPSLPPSSSSIFDYDRDFPPLSKFTPEPLPLRETGFDKDLGTSSPLRAKLSHLAPLPSKPKIDNFSRPLTKIVDESNNTISLTPKKPRVEITGQKQLSKQLQKLFPDVDETIQKESETFKERTLELDEIIEKLGNKSAQSEDPFDEVTFEFEFFNGGKNAKFDSFTKKFGLTNENIEFVDFLQSDYCKEIMQANDLKIHIETGNIYYNDTDTNESIFSFMKNQQDSSKGIINYDLKFDGSHKNYFQWILNEYDAPEKTKYDLFAFQNTKYLVYRFNDYQNLIGELTIKIRHSVVTDDYLAAKEIQNENWLYFIQRTIEVCKNKVLIRPNENFLLSTVENVTIAKKAYETFYDIVEKQLYLKVKNFFT